MKVFVRIAGFKEWPNDMRVIGVYSSYEELTRASMKDKAINGTALPEGAIWVDAELWEVDGQKQFLSDQA